MSKTYSEKMSRRTIAFVVVTLAVAFGAKAALRAAGVSHGGWLEFGAVLLTYCVFMVLAVKFWKGLDDMQRTGHAVSWYWGSLAGLAVTACLIAATGKSHSEFTVGVATLLVMQLFCSLLLYGFWSLRGRGFRVRSGE